MEVMRRERTLSRLRRSSQNEEALALYQHHWEGLHAWWTHSGNSADPHVELSGGDHSDGFMNCGVIAHRSPSIFQHMIETMVLHDPIYESGKPIDFVVAPAEGGVQAAYAYALAAQRKQGCFIEQYYTHKVLDESGKTIGMEFRRLMPRPGSNGIVFDDVITTSKNIGFCAQAAADAATIIVGASAILNRSGDPMLRGPYGEVPINALLEMTLNKWSVADCPLCKAGSEALRPKEENWPHLLRQTL